MCEQAIHTLTLTPRVGAWLFTIAISLTFNGHLFLIQGSFLFLC